MSLCLVCAIDCDCVTRVSNCTWVTFFSKIDSNLNVKLLSRVILTQSPTPRWNKQLIWGENENNKKAMDLFDWRLTRSEKAVSRSDLTVFVTRLQLDYKKFKIPLIQVRLKGLVTRKSFRFDASVSSTHKNLKRFNSGCPVSSEISDLCEISDLLLFFTYFASQNK